MMLLTVEDAVIEERPLSVDGDELNGMAFHARLDAQQLPNMTMDGQRVMTNADAHDCRNNGLLKHGPLAMDNANSGAQTFSGK